MSFQYMPLAKTEHLDRPKSKSVCDTEAGCVPWRKREINVGEQLSVSTAGLGAEWADGHCVSHVAERTVHVGVPHPLTAYIHTVCSVLFPIQNHTASRPPNTYLFGKLGHVPTVLSKTMPAIPPCASGGLREMQGCATKLPGDGRMCRPGFSEKQTPRWD